MLTLREELQHPGNSSFVTKLNRKWGCSTRFNKEAGMMVYN